MTTIFGMGTGRCGTTSLTGLLRLQPDSYATHCQWRWAWQDDRDKAIKAAREVADRAGAIRADMSPFWLPYVHDVAAVVSDARFVCLWRPRSRYVESWLSFTGTRNAWATTSVLDFSYPQTGLKNAETSAGLYWDWYMGIAWQLRDELSDRFRMVSVVDLNCEYGQRNLLDWLGVANPVMRPGIRLNTREDNWKTRLEGYPPCSQ